MVLRLLLTFLGITIAHLPTPLLRLFCWTVGGLFFHCHRRRRSLLCHNLTLALPQLGAADRKKLARKNASRLVELGLFSLAAPFLSQKRIRQCFFLQGPWQSVLENLRAGNRPQLLLIPHQTLTEALTFLPFLLAVREENLPVAILYRPFSNPSLEAFVRRTRERFGLRLISRKQNMGAATALLRSGGCLGLLFDQNAGLAGATSLLCDRVASTTPLPELLYSHGTKTLWIVHVERTDTFRGTIVLEPLSAEQETITATLDHWLETNLARNSIFRSNWLWSHGRWKRPANKILSLQNKRNALPHALAIRSLTSLPQRFPIAIRLPTSPKDWQPIHWLLSAVREGRPDALITLLCPAQLQTTARQTFPGADAIASTVRNSGPFDLYFTFLRSPRAGLEAIGTPLRVGFGPHSLRPFLTIQLPSTERHHLTSLGLSAVD